MKQCVLFLQSEKLTAFSQKSAGFCIDLEWPICGEELPGDLVAYLERNINAEFTLLFDLPEEECHLQDLKAAGFRDRRLIVEKLKSRRFESSLLTNATISKLNHDMSLLLTSVDNNPQCEFLINALLEAKVHLKAIHSATTLTPQLARYLSASKGAQLFVFPFHGCYRIVTCIDSSVLFTRRIALPPDSGALDGNVALLHTSIEETIAYVQRLYDGWIPSIVLIGEPRAVDQLLATRRSSPRMSEVTEIRSYQIPNSNSESPGVETLLLSLAARIGSGYASKHHRREYLMRKVRQVFAGIALCAIAGVASTVAVADKINATHDIVTDNYDQIGAKFTNDLGGLEARYEQPVEAVRQALVSARLLELSTAHSPMEFLSALVPGVRQSGVAITSVSWQADEAITEALLGGYLTDSASMEVVPLENIYRSTVAGIVAGSPDEALGKFELFISALRNINSNPAVVVVDAPFGLSDQHRTSSHDYAVGQGEFVVELSTQGIER